MAQEAVINDASLSPPEHILMLLGLAQASSATELRFMVAGRFRQPQQVQLAAMLKAMQSTTALANVTVWFSHQYDPTDDVEHYLQDLIRMHNYISAHDRQRPLRNRHLGGPELPSRSGSIYGMSRSGSVIGGDSNVSKQLMHFYASFPDTRDRNLLTKIYQTLGLARAITYCTVAQTLTFKVQKEFLDLFADGLPELRVWINWVDDLESVTSAGASIGQEGKDTAPNGAGYEVAVGFMGRTIREHCTITWLELLRPLDTPKRLEVIGAVHSLLDASNNSGLLPSTTATNVSSTLKKLGRFFETTSISVLKLLDLDSAVRRELSLLLEEFPTIVLITLFDKFNSEKMIHLVVKRGLPCFPKNDLLKMMSAVAPADTNAIEVFVATLFNFGRKKIDFLLLFLTFSSPNQLRFLDIMVVTANSALHNDPAYQLEEEEDDDAFSNDALMKGNFFLLKLFLYAHFSSADLVIHKLSTLPVELTQQLMYGVVVHSLDDFVVLGRGLETVELACLQPFLRLFFAVQLEWRETLVKLVEEMPGEETLLLYDTLLGLCSARSSNKVTTILQMLGGLDKKDKTLLCRHILVAHPETQVDQVAAGQTSTGIHARILLYLCECELSRHKVLRLLRATPFGEYDRLLSLLCTQRMPEQVVLTRLMLSIPSDVNCRILAKMSAWTAQALDAFFQLLLMLPKVEYKLFAKLMGSQYVTGEQLEMFIMVAVDMMNQASSRELVIFAAELPVHIRSLFLEMLVGQPEKGVLLRIISYSSRVAPELMHILVAQFHRMAWEIRSSFVEQLRALDASSDVENLAEFTSCLADSELLRRMVLMFNPFAIPIRVRLVTIFLQLNVHERVLALTRLVEMPKNTVSAFCAAICNPSCAPASPSFCRVMGLVDPKHHFSLLRLLNREPLWFFLRLMGEHCKHGVDEGIQADSPELLDRMAKLLEVFTAHDHHLVLKEVFREALADDMPLRDIVAVLSLFPDASRLLVFLRYANGFAKYARSSLLFRVLSKYQQSGFIFDMCRILDLDDAVFALKRLDRMWQRRHVELDKAMEPLAFRLAGGNAQVKDEFCDLIVGFRALPATLADNKSLESADRILIPRVTELGSAAVDPEQDTDEEEDMETLLRLPRATPLSHQPVQLNCHLKRTKPEQAFPRKRTDRKAWWQDLDDSAWLLLRIDRQDETTSPDNHTPPRQSCEQQEPTESASSLPSVFFLTEQPNSTRPHEVTASLSDCDNTNSSKILSSPIETLPPLSRTAHEQQSFDERREAGRRNTRVETEDINRSTPLCRSESAPSTLSYESPQSKQKRCRGVAAALDDQLEFHVGRDRGADFLQKQRDEVYREKGVSRIRHARTPAAQAQIMEARVSRALGTRQVVVQAALSPLARPSNRTLENAVEMLAKAAQLRESPCHGFAAELPIRDPPLPKHHARILPISTAKPSSRDPPRVKSDPNLSSEPVAPW